MKTKIFTLNDIKQAMNIPQVMKAIEKGFVLYSQGKVTVPPVGYLAFPKVHGDMHIKYGYIENDRYYVIKIASGFYDNPKMGLRSSNGLMLLFSQQTGDLLGILLDEGYLTDIRTALAGAIVAKYLAPKKITKIGIVGTGIQARLQLEMLQYVISCRDVVVVGRSEANLAKYKKDMELKGFRITTAKNVDELARQCNLIVTTTPSTEPMVFQDQIKAGTHITAMGADAKGKQEVDPFILQKADILVADSREQCIDHGEIAHGVEKGIIQAEKIVELGEVIQNPKLQRTNDRQITLADLTGVAIQDIQIATFIFDTLR